MIENRNGLIVEMELILADGYAERDAAIEMLKRLPKSGRRRTVAADKGYDTKGFVKDSRDAGFTPHVAQNLNRRGGSAIPVCQITAKCGIHRSTVCEIVTRPPCLTERRCWKK